MRIPARFLGCCLLASTSFFALAQAPAAAKPEVGAKVPASEVYDKILTNFETWIVGAAEAMPADKYDYAPPPSAGEFKGVRTFAGEVKHVAQANNFFFHDPDAPMVDNRAAIDKLTSKDDIVKALKDSFVLAHKYVAGITAENAFVVAKGGNTRGGQATMGTAHFLDHYGQMCVYLRMNGIIPPASRK
jgi:hypothetical protein